MLHELWVHQRVPYLLFSTNDEYHHCPEDRHAMFSIPIRSLLLWELFERDSPLVSAHQCRPVLGYFAWRLAVARLITCMACYSWLVDFGL